MPSAGDSGLTAPRFAQSGKPRTQEQPKQARRSPGPAKDNQRKVDEFAEAAQAINGPAGNPECVWLGRRVVSLMWRDDLDTAFRHLDLYDRFGCPGGHIQATFRCLVRLGDIRSQRRQESLTGRVHACWINPALQPAAADRGARAGCHSGRTASPTAFTPAPPAAARKTLPADTRRSGFSPICCE